MISIVCPISSEKIDGNVSRLTIFLNVVLMGAFIATYQPLFIYLVTLDYFIRAAINKKYSPVRLISVALAKSLNFPKKQIDLAPKIFASRLGLLCAIAALILQILELPLASVLMAGFLMILSTLDSVFNLCAGCLLYNYLVFPFFNKS